MARTKKDTTNVENAITQRVQVGTKLSEIGRTAVYTVTAVHGGVGEVLYFLELEKGGNPFGFNSPQRYVTIPASRLWAKFQELPVE